MEVMIPVQKMDFDFSKALSSSPYSTTAPSTPRPFGDFYHSTPSSPTRLSSFYREFDAFLALNSSGSSATVPFSWEEKPGTPKSSKQNTTTKYEEDEFAFDVSREIERTSITADELFDGGIFRPLKPPPRLQSPPLSPSSHNKKIIRDSLSPRQHKESNSPRKTEQKRGRERVSSLPSSSSGRRATRSLSPFRVSQYPWEEHQPLQPDTEQSSPMHSKPSLTSTTSALSTSSSKGYRKWRLKDFFLFRSASEGRAVDKYPLKKYASLFKRHEDVKQHSSFREVESPGSGSGSSSRRRVSAHELHYTMNRAVSEDLKKKTFLPYKQGILGRLAFNPAVHALANGFGFSRH